MTREGYHGVLGFGQDFDALILEMWSIGMQAQNFMLLIDYLHL